MGWDDQMRDLKTHWPNSHTFWRRMKRMGWDDQITDPKINWPSLHTLWRRMKRMGWDDQMRGLKTIDQIHVRSGDGWRGWDDQIRDLKQLTKFTYALEMDEEDEMEWWDERSYNERPSSRTNWRRMKRMGWDVQIRDLQAIEQVHVPPGERWRGWDGMIRWDILKQLSKITYDLQRDEERSDGRF